MEPDGLVVGRLAPEEARVHGLVAARGFGAPEAAFAPPTSSALASRDELGYYVGELEGEPVVTGLGLRLDDYLGVFDVARPPEARRRGYGAALTARIIEDGFDDGARWAWLQSSPDGHRVYQRLGFRKVAFWQCWIANPS